MDTTDTSQADLGFWAAAVRDEDFEKFPKFIKLLKLLKGHISSEGTSCILENQLKETSSLLKAAKSDYLQLATIYDIINEIKYQDKSNSKSVQLHRKIQEILVQKEVQQKLACLQVKEIGPAKSEHGLLGIDFKLATQPKTKLNDVDVKCLENMVDIRLDSYFQEITQLYSRMSKGDKHQFPKEKLSKEHCQFFSSIIETKRRELDEKKEKLEVAKQKQQRLIIKYYKILNNAVQSMMDIGEICNLNSNSSKKAEIMITKSEALLLKIRSFRLQLMTEIYNEDSLKAHLKIKECLDEAIVKLQSEKVLVEHRIAAYESVGSQFHALLNEYVDVMTKTEHRSWMLGMLPGAMQSEIQ